MYRIHRLNCRRASVYSIVCDCYFATRQRNALIRSMTYARLRRRLRGGRSRLVGHSRPIPSTTRFGVVAAVAVTAGRATSSSRPCRLSLCEVTSNAGSQQASDGWLRSLLPSIGLFLVDHPRCFLSRFHALTLIPPTNKDGWWIHVAGRWIPPVPLLRQYPFNVVFLSPDFRRNFYRNFPREHDLRTPAMVPPLGQSHVTPT